MHWEQIGQRRVSSELNGKGREHRADCQQFANFTELRKAGGERHPFSPVIQLLDNDIDDIDAITHASDSFAPLSVSLLLRGTNKTQLSIRWKGTVNARGDLSRSMATAVLTAERVDPPRGKGPFRCSGFNGQTMNAFTLVAVLLHARHSPWLTIGGQ